MAEKLNKRLLWQTVSFVLLLVAVPLVSIGTTGGNPLLGWLGFGALVLGGLIPPAQRLLDRKTTSP